MIITAAASVANTAGRACIMPAHRAQPGDSSDTVSVAVAQPPALAAAQHVQPEEPEQRGQQRQRRQHRERDGDRRGDGDAVEEADAEREHPEQRDADDDPGEQHGTAGGVDAIRRPPPRRDLPRMQALAIPGDDEQRVVDADAEADQQRELAS